MEKYIGKVLNDRYMITEVVGVGGMAYVFKAFDKVCNRVVAVKILKDEFMSDAQFRRRFTNESKAITMLSHDNIVDVYDVSLEGDALYIVMEYIDGITLKEYMEKKGILSPTEALHFLKQILAGLSHAHERGIVHRDIKPHNIVLLKDGRIKITDFGIARLTKFDTQTISDMAIGSVHYISPEQASGDRTDARSDIYSVGIILYEMLTGKLPFEADTAVAVALMQVQAQPDLPSEINADIPQGLEDITLKAIMKDPAIRYQSAGAILADIAQFEADPTITFNYLSDSEEEVLDIDNSPTISAGSLSDLADGFDEEEEAQEENDEAEEENKFKSLWLPIIAGVGSAIVIIALIVLGIVFQKELFGGNKIACPKVLGMTVEEAKEEYEFDFIISSTVSDEEHKAGTIISQDPAAGEDIKKKGKIKVVVSSGSKEEADEPIYMPNIVGMTRKDAIDKLDDAGIAYRIVNESSETVEKDLVISTDPEAEKEVESGDTVAVHISSGPAETEMVVMPDLRGLSLEIAKTTLSNNKLTVGSVTKEYSKTVDEGKIISQSVKNGDSVAEGTSVDLVISLGVEQSKVTMPNLLGSSLDVAKTTIENNKLKVGNITKEYSDTVEAGDVISQSVASGSSVDEGTAVDLVISLGKDPAGSGDGETNTDQGGTDSSGSGEGAANDEGSGASSANN